jgi:hypothetical protein
MPPTVPALAGSGIDPPRATECGDRASDLGMLGLQLRGVAAGAVSDQQSDRDPRCGDGCGQHCKQKMVLAGEEADREPDTDNDQHERVDSGVEKAEVELALGD